MEKSERIEFIDLAKGVCIVMVVMGHCNVFLPLPGLSVLRMPLYFILSGLFFKDKGHFLDFIIKKTNKILIPFLFFYFVGYLGFYLIKYLMPSLLITDSDGILDIFTNRQYFNGPIWFLLTLFWCNILFCIINRVSNNDLIKIGITIIVGIIGLVLGQQELFLPAFIDVAMSSLPFFVLGYYLKRSNLLYPSQSKVRDVVLSLCLYATAVALSHFFSFRMAFHYNGFSGWAGYLVATSSVIAVLLACKQIKHLPVISYLGRYSIIILCTHHLIYRPIKVFLEMSNNEWINSAWMLFILTISISYLLIPVCIRIIPWFVAQKDLIKINP